MDMRPQCPLRRNHRPSYAAPGARQPKYASGTSPGLSAAASGRSWGYAELRPTLPGGLRSRSPKASGRRAPRADLAEEEQVRARVGGRRAREGSQDSRAAVADLLESGDGVLVGRACGRSRRERGVQKKYWLLLTLHGADASCAGLPLGPVRATSISAAVLSGAASAEVSGFPKASVRASGLCFVQLAQLSWALASLRLERHHPDHLQAEPSADHGPTNLENRHMYESADDRE